MDDTFPRNQFCLNKFKSPYRLDKSKSSGGLLAYILSDLVSKQLSEYVLPRDFQAIPFEITLKEKKWLIVAVYNPHKQHGTVFLDNLSALIDFYLRKYDNYIYNNIYNQFGGLGIYFLCFSTFRFSFLSFLRHTEGPRWKYCQ